MNYYDSVRSAMWTLEVYISNNTGREPRAGWNRFQAAADEVRADMQNRIDLADVVCLDLSVGTIRGNVGALVCQGYFRQLAAKLRALAEQAVLLDPSSGPYAESLRDIADAMENRIATAENVLPSKDNFQIPLWIKIAIGLLVVNALANRGR